MYDELKKLIDGKILTEEDLRLVFEQLDEIGNNVADILLPKMKLMDSSLVLIITRKEIDFSIKLEASRKLFSQVESRDNCRIILQNLTDMPDKDVEARQFLLGVGRKLIKDNDSLEDAHLCVDCGININHLHQGRD